MKESAGLLLFRDANGRREVFLAHPGGPFWAKKDAGAWSIPKGEIGPAEEPLVAALREFEEETGVRMKGNAIALPPRRQPGGKLVHAWAMRGDLDPATVRSNRFELEWPPRSGRRQEFPEIDRAGWFSLTEAREKILKGQAPLLDDLERLAGPAPG
jgi:predicted NUDIX family NTP pyrophosphohydrolase